MLYNSGYQLILKQTVYSNDDLEKLSPIVSSFGEHGIILLLESENGFQVDETTWEGVKNLAASCEVLLGFGFNAGNVETLVAQTGVKGINMKGGHEIKPGIKDFDELAEILEALEIED
jgi:phosphoribosylanthranilate isomerase